MSENTLRVVHVLNQFFGGVGGEEQANLPVQTRDGAVGPGRALQQLLGDQARIEATIIGGDNLFTEQWEVAAPAVKEALRKAAPDVLVAGPAFNAGRYGLACGAVCALAQEEGIPAVTAMYHENPGVLEYVKQVYIVPTGESLSDMHDALERMSRLAVKLGRGEALGPAADEGYLPRGIRRPGLREHPAAVRAVDMVVARLAGKPFVTELPIKMPERVDPAPPLPDVKHATLALVTTGALVPKGNPDRMVRGGSKDYLRYSIEGLQSLSSEDWESVHRGFYTLIVNENPNYVLPLNIVRDLEEQRAFKGLHPMFLTTSGVGTSVADAKRIGEGMAEELKGAGVDGCLLVAT